MKIKNSLRGWGITGQASVVDSPPPPYATRKGNNTLTMPPTHIYYNTYLGIVKTCS